MQRFFFLLFLSLFCNCLFAQPPLTFEAEIRAFEQLDSIEKPAKGQILLYGSSTMRLWATFREDLAGYSVVNRGFGGSQMSDAIHYFDRVVVPLAPSLILLYEGDNDITNGRKTPRRIFKDYKHFMNLVHKKLPGTKVAIYTLRPSVARESTMPQQRELNALFRKYCKKHSKRAFFIDAYELLLTPDGKPNAEYLVEDRLHLNPTGYEVWAKVTRDFLKKQGL